MDPIEERSGISSMGSNPRPIYEELQPPDHTRVCFAAAIGAAMRGRYAVNGEAVGRLAPGDARRRVGAVHLLEGQDAAGPSVTRYSPALASIQSCTGRVKGKP